MKVADKLEYFKSVVNKEAEDQSLKLAAEADEKFQAASDAAEKDAERRANKRVQSELYKVETQKNKQLVSATVAAKRSIVELREHLTNEVFGNVAQMAVEFVKTAGYKAYLKGQIISGIRPYPGARIIVMERDRGAVEELLAEIAPDKLDFECTDEDFIGGYKIFLPERSAIVDCTLKSKIGGEKKSFDKLRINFDKNLETSGTGAE